MNSDQKKPIVYLSAQQIQGSAELAKQLTFFGFECRSYMKQSALLVAMHTEPPFAVLLGEEGLEDCSAEQILPRLQKLSRGPVLFLTSELTVVEQIHYVKLGVTDFVYIPLDIQKLIDRLDVLLEKTQNTPYRVLIVDDSEAMGKASGNILQQADMQVQQIKNPLDVFVSLERFMPDIVLMDVYMPQCSGDEMAKVIRQQTQFDSVPIVFLSTETNRNKQLMARSMGGDDFWVKNMPAEELVASVAMTCARYRSLRRWMSCDSLTALLNHTHIIEWLEREVKRSQKEALSLSFAMVDIDHFKKINDSYGHAVGDKVIKILARLLRQSINGEGAVGRYGGEEFAVVFSETSMIRAAQKIDHWRLRFTELIQLSGDIQFPVTFSAGVALLKNGMDAQQLIDAADEALYQAKHAGRNQVGLYQG
ncbi:diguanylate cyclase [Iodobacter fluviatilis]|uniref:diguanylate cyclase n=1 Tax=Iodobacter fluviatilis TaxID=537 RepID=A0A377Q9A6_9NEIS|nr:diguanylate cyclase [Iodobacter fluviatilis]TCU81759.1 response regulator receiver modulated diguanylate cyclase [Iodobacter fluviatilis]STQ91866.1 Stalked cell differentiation-controlling protein [Iodobacter fluviatilis]